MPGMPMSSSTQCGCSASTSDNAAAPSVAIQTLYPLILSVSASTSTSSSLTVDASARPDRRVELLGRRFRLHQAPALELGELADRAMRFLGLDDRIEGEDAGDAARDPLVVVAHVFARRLDALD